HERDARRAVVRVVARIAPRGREDGLRVRGRVRGLRAGPLRGRSVDARWARGICSPDHRPGAAPELRDARCLPRAEAAAGGSGIDSPSSPRSGLARARRVAAGPDAVAVMGQRVASLLPSATEIVCAVGAQDDLVGISHECDFPESVRHLPALTRARLRPVRSSREIDREVRSILQEALAVYEIELARLAEARPDVIVTQDLCDVCAVSFSDVCAATAALVQQQIRIVNLHPTRLDDIWADVGRVAEALGRERRGAEVGSDLQARTSRIRSRSSAHPKKPRVVSIEWLDPVMLGGMWMPELIEQAGGVPLVTRPSDHAPTMSKETLLALEPDVVL